MERFVQGTNQKRGLLKEPIKCRAVPPPHYTRSQISPCYLIINRHFFFKKQWSVLISRQTECSLRFMSSPILSFGLSRPRDSSDKRFRSKVLFYFLAKNRSEKWISENVMVPIRSIWMCVQIGSCKRVEENDIEIPHLGVDYR